MNLKMSAEKKIVAAGHICIDITPAIPPAGSRNIGDILSPGKLINVGAADIHTGGSVANTGLAMKLLSADVRLAGKIGCDAFGDMIYSIMDGYGAAGGLIRKEGENTSYSVVISVPGIDRIFLHDPGANDTFSSGDISGGLLDGAALFHFGYPPAYAAGIRKRRSGTCKDIKEGKGRRSGRFPRYGGR